MACIVFLSGYCIVVVNEKVFFSKELKMDKDTLKKQSIEMIASGAWILPIVFRLGQCFYSDRGK